jgi:fibronectin type 3 domain-containing protein
MPAGIFAQNSGSGTGLKGSYFANTSLTGTPAHVRTDATLNFQWGTIAPAPNIPVDQFSVRWTGQLEAPASGAFTFYTRSDDGVRLWVNKKLLIDHWNDHSSYLDQSVPVTLAAGQKYDVQLEYFENRGNSVMKFYWSYPGKTAEEIVPQSRLYPGDVSLIAAPPVFSRVWLSDLPWVSATNGDGPVHLDQSNGGTGNADGKPITIGGRRYSYGLGVHARSEIKYALDDQYDLFRSIIGVDDEVGEKGAVVFEVWLDGRRAYQSPVMRGNMPGLAIQVPVENARSMSLIVTSASADTANDHADWAEARFEGLERVKYLSDLKWTSSSNGVGPVERDRSNGGAAAEDGDRLKLRGQTYRKGLGTQAVAEIKYRLDRKYELFSSIVGIDDLAPGAGSAVFEVWNGTNRLYASPVMRRGDPVGHVVIPVNTVDELTLKVLDAGDGNTNDLADWADAKLLPIGSDFAQPTPPTGLDATPGNGKITLEWNAAPLATSYSIYRGTTAGGQAERPIATGIVGKTWVNTGLTNGTAYFYKIKAVNPNGTSSFSNEDSATPTLLSEPPAAPRNLDATPGDATVKLRWSASTAAVSYNVYRGTASNGQATVPVAVNLKVTEFTNTGLTNGTKYFYKVKAVNPAGLSPFSNEDSATPVGTAPAAPSELDATPGNAQVSLTWKASAKASSYNLYRGTTAGGQSATPVKTNITSTSAIDAGLTNGTKYFYKVKAVNQWGISGNSNEDSATPVAPLPLPGAPSGLTAAPADGTIRLSWTAATGAASYNVYRGTTANGQAAMPLATGITGTSFNNSGLTNGTAYFYKVSAVNATGVGPRSNEATATPRPPLTAPTGLTATPGNSQVTLAWTAVTNATSYNVYRGTASGGQSAIAVATGVTGTNYVNPGLTNGVKYFFKVAAVNSGSSGPLSNEASATPAAAVGAPTLSTAAPGNGRVTLTWTPVTGAASYQIFRGTSANGQAATPIAGGITATTYLNTGLTNGTAYFYKVAAVNANNATGAMSNELSATPVAPPVAPTGLSAAAADRQITLTWNTVAGAATYNVYAGPTANGQNATPVATALTAATFVHTGLTNGSEYFYKVTAVNGGGEGARSSEVNASPLGGAPPVDPATVSAFRLLRQSTWGPKPGDVDRVKQIGRAAFLQEQFAAAPSVYPETISCGNVWLGLYTRSGWSPPSK